MASVSMVYAKALFESASESKVASVTVQKSLKEFLDVWSSSAPLRAVMVGGAGASPQKRADILEDILAAMSIDGLLKRFLLQLCAKGRLNALPLISKDFDELINGSLGVLSGEIKSAVALSADQVSVLTAALEKRIGSKVTLSTVVDPSILGGVIATVAGKTFDGSLRSQMNKFKNELI